MTSTLHLAPDRVAPDSAAPDRVVPDSAAPDVVVADAGADASGRASTFGYDDLVRVGRGRDVGRQKGLRPTDVIDDQIELAGLDPLVRLDLGDAVVDCRSEFLLRLAGAGEQYPARVSTGGKHRMQLTN